MSYTIRWGLSAFLVVLSILMFQKGLQLSDLGTDVDGEGIGVHFLLFEINDSVHERNIPSYAFGFYISSIITALSAMLLNMNSFVRLFGRLKKKVI